MKKFAKNTALYFAIIAMFSAVITGGKMALAVIPNVEVVTIILATCAYVWGLAVALPVTVIFTLVQMAIYSFNIWVFEYLVYWPIVAVCFAMLKKLCPKPTKLTVVWAMMLAVTCTVLFGVFTSAVDTLIGYGTNGFKVVTQDYWVRFGIMYVRGVPFFLTHIISNAVIFLAAFAPLVSVNSKAKLKLFG